MANRSDLERSAYTLRGLLPSGEPVSAKDEFGGPALKPEYTLDKDIKTVDMGVLPTLTVYADNDDDKKTSKTEEAKKRKEERKVKRMEERTKRIGIRQGEKTRRVEARN